MEWRNVLILGVGQAIGFSGASLVLLAGGIVGTSLAPSQSLATLPITLLVVGIALFSIPAALIMKRIGRRRGFVISAVVAFLASLAAGYGIVSKSFLLFNSAMVFIGGNLAFVNQYRFAAAESVASRSAGKAISFVLVGGIISGYFGPALGRLAKDWLPSAAYAGSFASLAALYAAAAILLAFMRDVSLKQVEAGGLERPLKAVITQPSYLVAVLAGVIAFGVMGFIMTATPISMHVIDGYDLGNTTSVIQAHLIAMYLPSLFSGFLVDRLGAKSITLSGAVSMCAAVAINLLSKGFFSYLASLTALGLGWNLLFVGGSYLLSQSYYPKERFKAQAVNDFMIFTVQAFATLSAGPVIHLMNWKFLNLAVLPILLVTLTVLFLIRPKIFSRLDY